MAKRFFYVSLALLCLTAAYQLGVERAGAEWDTESSGQVVGFTVQSTEAIVCDRSGTRWFVHPLEGWVQSSSSETDLPVALSDVKFYGGNVLITNEEVAWVCQGTGVGWTNFGPFPGGPVPVEQDSWGRSKGRYRSE